MADAVTSVDNKFYSTGIKVVTVNMVCATGAAAFTSAVITEHGKELINVSTKPGSTGPTDDSDLTITDGATGRNLVAANGGDSVDNAVSNYVAPETNSIAVGDLTVAVANNSVNNAETTIYMVFKSKNL